jgi:polyisoprenoid-binding protein YceI
MIEVSVKSGFTDKITGVFHKVGDAFSCDEERAKDLEALGVVKINDAPTEKPKRTRKTKK